MNGFTVPSRNDRLVDYAEWGGQPVTMYEEEDALISPDGTARWIYRRQTELWLVR